MINLPSHHNRPESAYVRCRKGYGQVQLEMRALAHPPPCAICIVRMLASECMANIYDDLSNELQTNSTVSILLISPK